MTEKRYYAPSEAKGIKTPKEFLQSIMDPSRNPTAEQQFLIRLQEGRGDARFTPGSIFSGHSFAEICWIHLLDGEGAEYRRDLLGRNKGSAIEKTFFRRRLKGKALIDLGGGPANWSWNIAREFGSSTHINVDRYGSLNPPGPLKPKLLGFHQDKYSAWEINADMLDFISRVRSNIANCTINGIDDFIINDYRYHEAMAEEMVRVTKKGGLIFGYDSEVEHYLSCLAKKTKPLIRRILFVSRNGEESVEINPKKVDRKGSSGTNYSPDTQGFIFEKIK